MNIEMTSDEILQAAKEVGAVIDVLMLGRHDNTVFTTGELERFAAIIEKRTIERCAVVCEQRQGSYEANGFPREFTAARACAAAIAKATKSLEEEVEFQRTAHRRAEELMLEQGAQLAAAQEEIANMCNCEWKDIETAPKETEIFIGRFIDGKFRFGRSELIYEHANEFAGETWSGWLWSIDDCNDSIADCPTHWMPLPEAPHGTSS